MNINRLSYFAIIIFLLMLPSLAGLCQETIRIMAIGNSITEGYTDGSLTNAQMRGYRYGLRYFLKNSGYKVDFVGSQSGGSAYFSDCQHAGIGGTRDQYVVRLLKDGYDERNGVQILVPPRPYLDEYNPDILLLHIGTNDITHEGNAAITSQQISAILDLIDEYEIRANKEVVVFLALIINRVKPWTAGSPATITSAFNNAIKSMALARIAAGDKIVIVDMENNAGFTYSYSVDMAGDGQGIHPNELGYSKMANLWFSSINANYNTAPIITGLTDQSMNEGSSFNILSLDDFVSDIEDQDQNIFWTASQIDSNNLNITINANRELIVSPKDVNWNGSQTIALTATDLGRNGKYIKTDSDTMVFTVTPVNHAPVITSIPILEVRVGEQYSYTFTATDVDSPILEFSAISLPSWLTFSCLNGILSGTPTFSSLGQHNVVLRTADGSLYSDQPFTITVDNPDGFSEPENGNFLLYPVPAQDYLIIDFGSNRHGEFRAEIINTSGSMIMTWLLQGNQNNYQLNLRDLENGVYFLHLMNMNTNLYKRFAIFK